MVFSTCFHSSQFQLSLTNERTASVTDLDGTSSEEGDNNGDNVDGQLELKELCDAVVDVATPHHRLDDTRKVVISQDNVRRFLRHVRTRYSLQVTCTVCQLLRECTQGVHTFANHYSLLPPPRR